MTLHVLSYAKVYLITHTCIICDMKAKGVISEEGGRRYGDDSGRELRAEHDDLYVCKYAC